MKLLNVRLGPEDARMAARLREQGVPLSQVVREAIRLAYRHSAEARRFRRRASAIMADIYRECPDPPGLAPPRRGRLDSKVVRRVIRERLRRRP